MAIDAWVEVVILREDGSGYLSLIDRAHGGIAGQPRLSFQTAPYEVTALNWLNVWGGGSQLMLGDKKIADREGYTRISFIEREPFLAAVAEYHRKMRAQATGVDDGEVDDAHV